VGSRAVPPVAAEYQWIAVPEVVFRLATFGVWATKLPAVIRIKHIRRNRFIV
jgi:hypothetical protein